MDDDMHALALGLSGRGDQIAPPDPTGTAATARQRGQTMQRVWRCGIDGLPWLLVGTGFYRSMGSLRPEGLLVAGVCLLILLALAIMLHAPILIGVSGWSGAMLGAPWMTVRLVAAVGLLVRVGLEIHQQRTTARTLAATVRMESQVRALLAGTAHNIKHPLSNLQAQLRVLERLPHSTPVQAQLLLDSTLPLIQEQATLLEERVGHTLELSRHVVLPFHCEHTTLGAVEAALQPMLAREQRTMIPPLQLSLRCDQPGASVWTDPAAITACVENLIRNAAYAQRDRPSAVVTVRLTAHAAARMIAVEDCGPGFPPTVLAAGYADATHAVAGHGLGLVGVQAIIGSLGGDLALMNRPAPASGALATLQVPAREGVRC